MSDVGNGPAFDTVRLIEAAWTRVNVIPRSVAVVVGSVFATPLLGRHVKLGFAIDVYTRPQSMCMSIGRLRHERPDLCLWPPSQIKVTLAPFPIENLEQLLQPKYTYKMLRLMREEELLQVLDSLSKAAAISIHMKRLQQFHENNHAQASAEMSRHPPKRYYSRNKTFGNGARSMATGCRYARNAVMLSDDVETSRDAR